MSYPAFEHAINICWWAVLIIVGAGCVAYVLLLGDRLRSWVIRKGDHASGKCTSSAPWTIYHNDCVLQAEQLPNACVDFSVFSPPFADLYVYSDDPRDMGNNASYDGFRKQFGFLVQQLGRIVKPGRLVAVHCMDLPVQKGKEGFIGLRDFSGLILDLFAQAGFIYHTRITIWKDPVVEMQRTKALGLLHKQLRKDSSMSRVGIPDYILVFRNAGENETPIRQDVSVDTWQKWASPVWMDVDYGKTLNRELARAEADEKHIAPLQLETIERLIALYSNPGELVFSPFAGIGSEGYQAVLMGRRFLGVELKESYYNWACRHLAAAEQLTKQQTLFSTAA